MEQRLTGKQLVNDLLTDPCKFEKQGRAYQLLQEYLRGFELETLRPLLRHQSDSVRRAAIFVASELGASADILKDDIAVLVRDSDPRIKWDALESVMTCSASAPDGYFALVSKALEDENDSIRRLAMRLLCNATSSQIESALQQFDKDEPTQEFHKQGLNLLLDVGGSDVSRIAAVLDSDNFILSKYGAIAAKRSSNDAPALLEYATKHPNPDVARFAMEARS